MIFSNVLTYNFLFHSHDDNFFSFFFGGGAGKLVQYFLDGLWSISFLLAFFIFIFIFFWGGGDLTTVNSFLSLM
jgi:hypothetical protein